jgi:hypothetical protein
MPLESGRVEGIGLDLDRVRRKVAGRRSAPGIDALGEEKSERELLVVSRGAHRHRDRRAVDANLERLLDRDRVTLPAAGQSKDIDGGGRVGRGFHRGQSREPREARPKETGVEEESHFRHSDATDTCAFRGYAQRGWWVVRIPTQGWGHGLGRLGVSRSVGRGLR